MAISTLHRAESGWNTIASSISVDFRANWCQSYVKSHVPYVWELGGPLGEIEGGTMERGEKCFYLVNERFSRDRRADPPTYRLSGRRRIRFILRGSRMQSLIRWFTL